MAVCNILFITCDQLRADYLSAYGHPRLKTPHITSAEQQQVAGTTRV
jgi:arylsulfatase A-like enzyme